MDSKLKQSLTTAIKESPVIEKPVQKCITSATNGTFSNCKEDVEFKTGDLYYSVQHANMIMSGVKEYDTWKVDVKVYDTYDFDRWRWQLSVGGIANNLGFVLQRTKLLETYEWEVEFTMEAKEKVCKIEENICRIN